jgi:hypothetical protein
MASKRHYNGVHLQKKSVINMMWLPLSGFDWRIIMIGPGGLLLVVSFLPICPPSLSFMGAVARK